MPMSSFENEVGAPSTERRRYSLDDFPQQPFNQFEHYRALLIRELQTNRGIAGVICLFLVIVCSVLIAINGGGGGGSGHSASRPAGSQTVPADPKEIAMALNNLYMGYNPSNPLSPLGVVIRMSDAMEYYCGGACFKGEADCRVSTSLINHRVMITKAHGNIAGLYGGRESGIVFNETAVQTKLAKCSYMFDGATFNRLNGGCGCGGGPMDCNDPLCSYKNIDPETGQKATGTSHHVTRCHCGDPDLSKDPHSTTDEQCYWKGPAFYMADGVAPDETGKMVAQRVANDKGEEKIPGQPPRIKNEYWDEVVLDANVVLSELERDPASVVSTFFYLKGSEKGRGLAMQMSEKMAKDYGMPKPVPVVALDATSRIATTRAPFIAEGASSLLAHMV